MRIHPHYPDELAFEDIAWLTAEQVHTFHDYAIRRFGGVDGVLHPGAVDAALGACQNAYCATVLEHAARLWVSLTQDHAFRDGNKRTAFIAMRVFMQMNGLDYTQPDAETYDFITENLPDGRPATFTVEVVLAQLTRFAVVAR